MLPPEGVLRAAGRWLQLLRTSHVGHAWSLILSGSTYSDLTQTQYGSALEWLRTILIVVEGPEGLSLSQQVSSLPLALASQYVFEQALEFSAPGWLGDADMLIPDPTDLPQDARALAESLQVPDTAAFNAVLKIHGRIDLLERERIGFAGEQELVRFLETFWPGSTSHVSILHDGFGYDVIFTHDAVEWHLEIKSTVRRGRLSIHLSRHEHSVGCADPNWRLVVIGLDRELHMHVIATANHSDILQRAPKDHSTKSAWETVVHHLASSDLQRGLVLEGSALANSINPGRMHRNVSAEQAFFGWWPSR
jgi:hypothetical protein